MMRRRGILVGLSGALLALSLSAAGCGGAAAPKAASTPPAQPSPSTAPAGSGASAPSGGPGGLQTVRIALSTASPSNAGVYVAEGLGYFTAEGIRVDSINFGQAASQIVPALVSNRLDVADVGINPAMFNAMTRGLGIKVVADKGSTPKGFGFTSIVVRKALAGQIKGPADLKGRTIAMTPPGLGTSNGFALQAYLARAHLTPADVHIQPIAFPAQPAALTNGAVPVAMMAEPFATEVVLHGIGVRLATNDQIVPDQQIAALAYAGQFVSKHPGLAEKFMIAYIKGIRTYDEAFVAGVNKAKIVDILASKTAVHNKQLWSEMIPAGLNPNGLLNLSNMQQEEDFFHQVGLVKVEPPLSSFVDESFAKQADKTLGPPPAAIAGAGAPASSTSG
jgi:NitT/TauT family transport system substrate-binding protein